MATSRNYKKENGISKAKTKSEKDGNPNPIDNGKGDTGSITPNIPSTNGFIPNRISSLYNNRNPFQYSPMNMYKSHIRTDGPTLGETGIFVVNPIGSIHKECEQFPSAVYLKVNTAVQLDWLSQSTSYRDLLFDSWCFPKANLITAARFEKLYSIFTNLAKRYHTIEVVRACQAHSNPMFKELVYAYMTINKVINCCIDIIETVGINNKLYDLCDGKTNADIIVRISRLQTFDIMDVEDTFLASIENLDEED